MSNENLDNECIKSIQHLFQKRAENSKFAKYAPESEEYNIINNIPILDKKQLLHFNNISNVSKSKADIAKSFKEVNFNYNYNLQVIDKVRQMSAGQNPPPEIAPFLMFYQVIGRVFFSDSPMNSSDFVVILDTLNILVKTKHKDFLNSSFYLTIMSARTAPHSHFKWNEACCNSLTSFYMNNNTLSADFYDYFVHFLNLVIQPDGKDALTNKTLQNLREIFKQGHPIIKVKDLSKINDLISPLLMNLHVDAIRIFAYITKYDESELIKSSISHIPHYFTSIVQKNAIESQMVITVAESHKIHEYSSVFIEPIYQFDFKHHEINVFNDTFHTVPKELSETRKGLYELIPQETRQIVRLFKEFFDIIKPSFHETFFNEMNKALQLCLEQKIYDVFASYLYLLDNLGNNYFAKYITLFYPKPRVAKNTQLTRPNSSKVISINQKINLREQKCNVSFRKAFFDPSCTVFGPNSLDPKINLFRAAILDIIKKQVNAPMYISFIETMKGYPFLMAEMIGRSYFLMPLENICRDQFFKSISREMVALQMMNAPVPARNSFFLFFFEFLKGKQTIISCLSSSVFVDALFRFLFENGVYNQLIKLLHQCLLAIDNTSTKPEDTATNKSDKCPKIDPSVAFLLKTARNSEILRPLIFSMITDVLKLRPYLIKKFAGFVDLILTELSQKKTKESFDNAILIISEIANFDTHFDFNAKYFQTVAPCLHYANYPTLYNMIFGTYSLSSGSMYAIRQPKFIPLFLIAYANDPKINDIIVLLAKFAKASDYNARALHDGDVDLIFLKYLNNETPIVYKGFSFTMNVHKSLINAELLTLLELITTSKSSHNIAKRLTQIIVEKHNLPISKLVNKILGKTSANPSPAFSIGTLKPFCTIIGLNNTNIKGDLTITFWLKTDQTVLSKSTAVVNILSITDRKNISFNIILQNNTLFASFEGAKFRTVVSLCQRMNNNGVWTHFAICFNNLQNGKPLISTYKDFERLHDSEFCFVDFAQGPLVVNFGGSSFDQRKPIFADEVGGSVSRIFLYNRILTVSEIVSVMFKEKKAPINYTVTSADFTSKMRNKLIDMRCNEVSLKVNYVSNSYHFESLHQCMSNDQMVERLVESMLNAPRELVDQILSILAKIISNTSSRHISPRITAILLNIDVDYKLYSALFNIISNISNKVIQRYWFEDILINCSIWCRCDTFYLITHHYSTNIICSPFFLIEKSYFCYFLNQFNKLFCEQKNEKAKGFFITFLERLAHIKFEMDDALKLISYTSISSDEDKVIYLGIVGQIAKAILKAEFAGIDSIYNFVSVDKIDIVVAALVALHELYPDSFHTKPYAIISLLKISLTELFERLCPLISNYPNLFSLVCAIGLQTQQDPSDYVPESVTLSKLWYMFPLLLSLQLENNEKLIDFVSKNVVKSTDIDTVYCFALYLNIAADHMNHDNILHQVLHGMIKYADRAPTTAKKYQIFFIAFASAFFKKDADQTTKKLMDLYKASVFRGAVTDPRRPTQFCIIRIRNYKNITEFLYQCSELSGVVFDIESLPEHIRYAVKSNNYKYCIEPEDIDILKGAYKISDSLIDYPMKGIETRSTGGIIKQSLIPVFGMNDVRELIGAFIDGKLSTDSLEAFNRRIDIFDYVLTELDKVVNIDYCIDSEIQLLEKEHTFITPIVDEMCYIYIKQENERILNQNKLVDRNVTLKRSSTVGYAMAPFLMDRQKSWQTIRRINPKSMQIRENCIITNLNGSTPAIFAPPQPEKRIYTIKYKSKTEMIHEYEIQNIFYIDEKSMELLTFANKPYYIVMKNADEMAKVIQQLPLNNKFRVMKDELFSFLDRLKNEWVNRSISTFKYLNFLNLISGRTYEDLQRYPVFPSLSKKWEDESMPSLGRTLFLKDLKPEDFIQFENRLFVLPELYYLFESDSIESVYQRRKLLEKAENIHEWITRVFSKNEVGLFRVLFDTPHPPRNITKLETKVQQLNIDSTQQIIFASLYFSENKFIVVFSNGDIGSISVNFNESGEAMLVREPFAKGQKILNPEEYQYSCFNTGALTHITAKTTNYINMGIVAYKRGQVKIITDKGIHISDNIYIEKPIFSGSVFMSTTSTLSKIHLFLDPQVNNIVHKTFCNIHANVTSLQCSATFAIVAIGSDDCKLRIRSIQDGSKIATVSLENEVPSRILITDSWGFIVVFGVTKLFLFSLNGILIKKVDNFPNFKQWFTYKSIDDFDFVGFEDTANQLWYFEAMYPENRVNLTDFKASIVAVRFDPKHECFLVLTDNGRMMVFPYNMNSANESNSK